MKSRYSQFLKTVCIFLVFSTFSFGDVEKVQHKENEKTELGSKIETDTSYFNVYDPWEPFNRRMYYFNYHFDKYIFLPVVNTYTFITPDIVETGVSNFYDNSKNVSVMVNSAAQGKVRKFMKSLGRFSMNSILGIFGVVDVASDLNMPKPYEDFGTTFAYYGVPEGPYLVLPILGPTNLKNAVGSGVDMTLTPEVHPYAQFEAIDMENMGVTALNAIDTRKNVKFRYYGSGSPFEYEYTRFIYTEFRRNLENRQGAYVEENR